MTEMDELQIQIKDSADEKSFPDTVVIIPIMNSPIFPGMIAPIILTEDKFTPELDEQILKSGFVALNLVKNELKDLEDDEELDDEREINSGDIYKVGILCKVVKKLKLPDGSVNVLVHGIKRYRASEILSEDPILKSKIEVFDDILEADEELDAYTRSVINQVKKLSEINPYFNEEMKLAMLNTIGRSGPQLMKRRLWAFQSAVNQRAIISALCERTIE